MRSKLLVAGVLAAMLVTAGCAGTLASTGDGTPASDVDSTRNDAASAAQSTPDVREAGKRIEVGSVGKVGASPDRAVVRVGVEVTAPDAATARRQLAENVSAVYEALGGMGVEDDRIATAYFDIDRDFRRRPDPRSEEKPEVVYRGRHSLRVTLSDLNRTGDVIVTAVESGATEIGNVEFTLSERTRRDLRQRALSDAMRNARRQAETIAESSDSLDSGSLAVRSVRTSEVEFDFRRGDSEVVLEASPTPAAAGAPTSIESGRVTVTARVVVAYEATG